MSSRRQQAIVIARFAFAFLLFSFALALLIRGASTSATAHAPQAVMAQDEEKSLDIPRYPNAPVEMVDLKIREKSVKDKINSKLKGNNKQVGLDNVKFREKNDWFKDIKLTLRNISAKPIYGLAVSLIFKDENLQMGFAVPVKESQTRDLKGHPLQPGEEVDLAVDNVRGAQILSYMYQNGVDANRSSVQLSVEGASFSDDFGWRQGVLMRRSPLDPKRWDVIDKPEPSPTPSEASRLFQPAGFKVFDSLTVAMTQDLNRCVSQIVGFRSWACNGDENNPCDTVRQYGEGQGNLTRIPVLDFCIYRPGPLAEYCYDTLTFHDQFTVDTTCPAPGSTPTPLSCLPDGYVYYPGGIPCCSGSVSDGVCGPAPPPIPSPTPTPMTCVPNNQMTFGLPCCSGYQDGNGICRPNPSATPTPLFLLPNGSVCFSPNVCQSGYCGPDYLCAPPPQATPTPPYPDGYTCSDDSECQSFYCDFVCSEWDGGGGGGGGDDGCYWSDCSCWDDWECGTYCDWDGYCAWGWLDPILIDLNGDGFAMTDAANGVAFDFFGQGLRREMSWTAAGTDDAWLVLDRNRNGTIDSGKEMFSNAAPQPSPPAGSERIGFAALAEYDKSNHGGNGDRTIDKNDSIFPHLRLWQDVNHNGISEASELHSLTELGVESLSLDYKESRRTDRWGNTFRYRAKVYGTNHKDLGRWAYDVVLFTKAQSGQKSIAAVDGLSIWQNSLLRQRRPRRFGAIDDLARGKSLLRQLSSPL